MLEKENHPSTGTQGQTWRIVTPTGTHVVKESGLASGKGNYFGSD